MTGGSWPRFVLGIMLAPWALLLLLLAFVCVLNLFHPSEYVSGIPFGQMLSSVLRRLPMIWVYLAAPLALLALLLRRAGLTRTRHHVLGSMLITALIAGSLALIRHSIAAEAPVSHMEPAVAAPLIAEPSDPYCTGPGISKLFPTTALLLLLTIPALVFSRIAYGALAARTPEPKWRAAGWVYAASLPLSAVYFVLNEFGLLRSYGYYWC